MSTILHFDRKCRQSMIFSSKDVTVALNLSQRHEKTRGSRRGRCLSTFFPRQAPPVLYCTLSLNLLSFHVLTPLGVSRVRVRVDKSPPTGRPAGPTDPTVPATAAASFGSAPGHKRINLGDFEAGTLRRSPSFYQTDLCPDFFSGVCTAY